MVSFLCGCTKRRKDSLDDEGLMIDSDYSEIPIAVDLLNEDVEIDSDYSEIPIIQNLLDDDVDIDSDYSEIPITINPAYLELIGCSAF